MNTQIDGPLVLLCSDLGTDVIDKFLARYDIAAEWVAADSPITGSFWGAPEAGIVRQQVFVRPDTPVHSLLHEVCHIICMTPDRREALDGNAGSNDLEESAVCYLQVVLADYLPGVGRQRLIQDMDSWGYSFREGAAAAWFAGDGREARAWLTAHDLMDPAGQVTFKLRA